MRFLDRTFLRIRSCPLGYRFTLFTRVLLAAGFLPSGMVKLLGHRFTLIPPGSPVGDLFEALYRTGLYWRFLGLSQVVAALLLLVPRLAHLGAALFLPILANVFVITVSLHFRGTPLVTGAMLLAALWLLVWDFHRFRPLLTTSPLEGEVPAPRLDGWERLGFGVFAASLVSFFLVTRSLVEAGLGRALVVTGAAAGLFTLGRFLWTWRAGRSAPRSAAG